MATLTGTKIKDTYDGLLKVSDNVGLNSTKKIITDGLGNNSSVKISTSDFEVGGFFYVDIDGNLPDSKIGIGTSSPSETLHVVGNFRLTAKFYDGSNSAGASGRVLMSTGSATSWSNTFTASMTFDSGVQFNAGIKDYTGSKGTAGQVLSSTGSNNYDIEWVSLSEIQGVDGSGTANYIPIWTDSDTLGNSVIYQSSSNIGIGTLSPGSYKLNVFGEFKLNSNGSGYMQSDYGDHKISIYDGSNNEVIIFQDLDGNSANQLVVASTGVGIGNNAPGYKLDVYNDSTNGVVRVKNAANGRDTLRSENAAGTRTFNIGNDANGHGIVLVRDSSGTVNTYIAGSGNSYFNAGNIGIGTTSPDSKLEVITSGSNSVVELDNSDTNYTLTQYNAQGVIKGFSGFNTSFMIFGGESGTDTRLQAGGQYALTINNSTQNVGIGTISPSEKLEVEGNILVTSDSATSLKIQAKNSSSFNDPVLEFVTWNVASGASSGKIQLTNGAWNNNDMAFYTETSNSVTEKMRITSTGEVGIGTTAPDSLLHVAADVSGANTGTITIEGRPTGFLGDNIATIDFHNNGNKRSDIRMERGNTATDSQIVISTSDAGTLTDRFVIKEDGQIQLNAYGSGTFTGTVTQRLGVDSSGNIIELAIGSGAVDGSGTAGYITKWTDGDTIGDSILEVNSALPNDVIMPQYIRHTGDTNTYFGFYSNDTFLLATDNTERMRVTSDGNVGIGTTSPYYKLDTRFANTDTSFSGGSGGNWGSNGIRIENTSSTANTMSVIHLRNSDADIHIAGIRQGTDDSDLGFFFESLEKVRFTHDGNVGIGYTSPLQKLDVNGDARATNFRVDSARKYIIGNGNQYITGTNDTSLEFYSGGSERMRIKNDGKVGIGTTSPVSKLHVVDGNIRVTTSNSFSNLISSRAANPNAGGYNLGGLLFQAYAGMTNYTTGAAIYAYADGAAWTSNSVPSYLSFHTATSGSATTTEKMVIKESGKIKMNTYGSGTFTGTATQRLAVDSSGNIIEVPIGSGAVDGSGTANTVTMWSDADTLTDAPITISGNNATFSGANTYNKIQTYYSGNYTSGWKFSDYNGGIWYDAGADDLTLDSGHANSQILFNSGGELALTLDASQAATFKGSGTFETILNVIATDDGGSPAMTSRINMHGYDGRGVGIKMKDNVTTSGGGDDNEWFIGTGYNQSGFNIGYASDGSQSSYSAQAKLQITTSGDATFAGSIHLADTEKINLGNANDLQIRHLGGTGASYIENYSGDLQIFNYADGKNIVFQCDNTSGGTTEYFKLNGSTGETVFSRNTQHLDQVYAQFGADDDAVIYHDGTESTYFKINNGDLYIRNESDADQIYIQGTNSSGQIANYLKIDGNVEQSIFDKDIRVNAWLKGASDTNTLYSSTGLGTYLQSPTNSSTGGHIYFRNHSGTVFQTFSQVAGGTSTFANNVNVTGVIDVRGGGAGYNSIKIANNITANNNKQAGITTENYAGNSVSIIQYATHATANTVYYGSADGAHSGLQNHRFYVNADVNTPGSGHTQALHIGSDTNATFAGYIHSGGRIRIQGGTDNGSQLNLFCDSDGDAHLSAYTFSINTGVNNSRTESLKIDNNKNATFAGSIVMGGATLANNYMIEMIPTGGNILRSTRGTSVFGSYQSNNGAIYIGATSNHALNIITNDTSRISITNDGNVGIGTTSPVNTLEVKRSTGDSSIRIQAETSTDSSILKFRNSNADADITVDYTTSNRAKMVFTTDNDDGYLPVMSFEDDRSTIMYGKVGIGTTTPSGKLHVTGTSFFYGSGAAALKFGNTSTLVTLTYSGTTGVMRAESGSALEFHTNGVNTALTLDTSQNATFAGDVEIQKQLTVGTEGTAGTQVLKLEGNYSSSGNVKLIEFYRVGGAVAGDLNYTDATTDMELGTSTAHSFSLKTGGTRALTIDSSQNATFAGDVTVSGTSFLDGLVTIDHNLNIQNNGVLKIAGTEVISATRNVTLNSRLTFDYGGDHYLEAGTDNLGFKTSSNSTVALIDYANSRVGIGSTSPSEKLEVAGNIKAYVSGQSSDVYAYYSDGTFAELAGNGLFFNRSNAYLAAAADNFGTLNIGYSSTRWGNVRINAATVKFENGANERMRIDSSGNVGIGTTSPVKKLDVVGSFRVQEGTSGTDEITTFNVSTHGLVSISRNHATSPSISTSFSSGNSALSFVRSGVTRTKIECDNSYFSGKVGIGTTSPDCGLEIYGADNTGAKIKITNTNATDNEWSIYANYNTQDLIFLADSVEVLRLGDGPSATFAGNVTLSSTLPLLYLANTTSTTGKTWRFSSAANGKLFITQDGVIDAVTIDHTTGNATFAGEVTSKGSKLTENTTLYTSDASISYYSSSNAVYVNGAGNDGWLRLNASGVSNDVNAINIFGTNQQSFQTFKTAGSTRMLINSSGQIGIGTTSPSEKLEVNGNIKIGSMKLENISAGGRIGFNRNTSNGAIYNSNYEAFQIQANGAGYLETQVYNSSGGYIGSMALTDDLKLGIGTTSPSSKLDVVGGAISIRNHMTAATGFGYSSIYSTGNQGSSYPFTSAGNLILEPKSGSDTVFLGAVGVVRMVVKGGGNVGIGTTAPSHLLSIGTSGNASGKKLTFYLGSSDGNYAGIGAQRGETNLYCSSEIRFINESNSSGSGAMSFNTGLNSLNERMRIDSSGNVGIGTTSPTAKLNVVGTGTQLGSSGYYYNTFLKDTTNSGVLLGGNNTANGVGFLAGVNELAFLTYGTSWEERMRVTSDGFVIHKGPTGAGTNLQESWYYGTDSNYRLDLKQIVSSGLVKHSFNIVNNGVGYDNNLVLDRGNVGIGTNSPDNRLDVVVSDVNITPNTESSAVFRRNGNNYISILSNSSNWGGILFGQETDANDGALTYDHPNGNMVFETRDAERMRITSTGNVGIGTTSPAKQLTISSTTPFIRLEENQSGGNKRLDLWVDQNAVAHIDANQSASQITLRTASTDRLRITNAGNVGIGNTTPKHKLYVSGDIGQTDGSRIWFRGSDSSSATGAQSYIYSNSLNLQIKGDDNVQLLGDSGSVILHADYTGRVGIATGSTQPTYKLDVGGDIGTDRYIRHNGDTNTYFGFSGSDTIQFNTNGNERMRMDFNGNVGINTTSPDVKFDVIHSDTGAGYNDGVARFHNNTTSMMGGAAVLNVRNSYNAGYGGLIKFWTTSIMSSVGNISFNSDRTAVNYNTTSDYRLKEDYKDFDGLDITSKIKVYDFKWKNKDYRSYGVIAHELNDVVPSAVTGEKDGDDMQAVDYSKLVPLLLKSVQELKEENLLLKARVSAIEKN